jgi:DNA polymerase I-like protein with 3'-5' exonuclease and polymerase domains
LLETAYNNFTPRCYKKAKMTMIIIHRWLREEKLGNKMILWVHDEFVFDAVAKEMDYITPKIKELMTVARYCRAA